MWLLLQNFNSDTLKDEGNSDNEMDWNTTSNFNP